MKKILRLSATLIGAFALVTGFTACNKDDDHGECCTVSGTLEDGVTYKYTACQDGTYSYSDSTGYSYSGTYSGLSDNWEYYKSYAKKIGASCS